MGTSNNCLASAWTSAAAFLVSTKPAKFVGISYYGSAAATTIDIFDGVTTAGKKIATVPVGITAGGFSVIHSPIVCTAGIIATNVGTVGGYAIFYIP